MFQFLAGLLLTILKKGFTIIELIVVLGMFVLVIGGANALFTLLFKNTEKTQTTLDLKQETNNAVLAIHRRLLAAQEVLPHTEEASTVTCALGMTGIAFRNPDGGKTEYTCETDTIASSSSTLRSELINTALSYQIQNCQFSCFTDIYDNPSNVEFSFTLTQTNGKMEVGAVEVVLRNTRI